MNITSHVIYLVIYQTIYGIFGKKCPYTLYQK